jgi:uncharacterized RDD family membrane protein YckC
MEKSQRPTRYPQLAKEPLLTSTLRANPENRLLAKVLDFVFGIGIQAFFAFLGSPLYFLIGFLYWGAIDALGRGQSPGKWIVGLHTVEVGRGLKIRFYQGVVRNFLFMSFSFLIYLQSWYWNLLLFPVCIGLVLETFFIFRIRSGLRVGDVLGSTRVADYKDQHTQFVEQFLKDDDWNAGSL